ncbi:MAG: hypothetical protein IPK24_15570 [Kineosporiaceae bacterium]|nr:hypothetical protein [Kineosporiaceae bacterium]
MTEGAIERVLLGATGAGIGEPAPQIHLPRDERDQRDRPTTDGGLDELGELLRLAAEELTVLHRERQPQHEFVEEQDNSVIAQPLGMAGDRGETGIEVDVLGLLGIRTEVRVHERRHELLTSLRGRRGRSSFRVAIRIPRPRPEHGCPRVDRGSRPGVGTAVQAGEELRVAELDPQPLGVLEQGIRPVDGGQQCPRVSLTNLADVSLEQRLLHGLRAEQVERQRQDPALRELGIVLGDHSLQLRLRPGGRLMLEESMKHSHEVRLTRSRTTR